jgi:hypothetical protein
VVAVSSHKYHSDKLICVLVDKIEKFRLSLYS